MCCDLVVCGLGLSAASPYVVAYVRHDCNGWQAPHQWTCIYVLICMYTFMFMYMYICMYAHMHFSMCEPHLPPCHIFICWSLCLLHLVMALLHLYVSIYIHKHYLLWLLEYCSKPSNVCSRCNVKW